MPATRDAATKGDRTRRRLLDATAAEVARCGRAAASLSGIAAVARVKTGSIYFHFDSKEQLIDTMLEEGLRETLRYLDAALAEIPDHNDAGERLWAAVRAHLHALVDLGDYAAVVLRLESSPDGRGPGTYRALIHRYDDRWTALVGDAQRTGAIAAGADPRLVLKQALVRRLHRRRGPVALVLQQALRDRFVEFYGGAIPLERKSGDTSPRRGS